MKKEVVFILILVLIFVIGCGPKSGCMDSDGGIEYYIKGYLEVEGQHYEDYCVVEGGVTVHEYYCDSVGNFTVLNSTEFPCPYGCEDGACQQQSCSDTDEGLDYYEAGTVLHGGFEYPDFCYSAQGLNEQFCNGSMNYSKLHICAYECVEGACIDPDCEVSELFYENEPKVVTFQNLDYDIEVIEIVIGKVNLTVNGEEVLNLELNDVYEITDGSWIKVLDFPTYYNVILCFLTS